MKTRMSLVIAIAALVAGAGLVLSNSIASTVSADADQPAVRAAITLVIDSDNATYVLSSGHLPSGQSVALSGTSSRSKQASDRTAIRDRLTADLTAHMGGTLLAQRLDVALPWADSVSAGGNQVFDLFKTVESLKIDSVVRQGNAATVTGTETIYVEHAQPAGDVQGHLVTWGGRGTEAFSGTLELTKSQWIVTNLQLEAISYTPNASLESGSEYIPAQTKPSPPAPLPVVP